MESPATFEVSTLLMGLLGGLALFLYGMEQMTDALKSVAGAGMKKLLARLTTNRFKAAFAGAFVTAVIQSSSVTTVLVVGFISAGIMSLSQSIGIIMGANIGTTITAQIIAFKVTHYALVLVALGFAMLFAGRKERIRHYGGMLMGLGLIFFGMDLMSNATRPLRSYEPFIEMMRRMDNPFLGLLISAGFTGLVQSSSATTGVIIVLASQGFISLEAGIALAFGANIGTCITALLAAIGKPREAVQAAAVHVLFNVLGVVLWFWFIDELAMLVRSFSPASPELSGVEQLGAETPRQIANAHSIFNIANTLIFIWFTTPLAALVRRLVPERPADTTALIQPRYLDAILLETPALALDRVRMELRRLGEQAHDMVRRALPITLQGTHEDLLSLAQQDDTIDLLHGYIISYLGQLSKENLTERDAFLLQNYVEAANNIESIADMIETNLVDAGEARLQHGITVSPQTHRLIEGLHERVSWAVQLSLQALDASDPAMAQTVIDAKGAVNAQVEEAQRHLARRLTAQGDDRLAYYRLESEIIEYLKRVYYFAKRVAKSVTAVNGPATPAEPASMPASSA